MPNFPSIYIELQELWKAIRKLAQSGTKLTGKAGGILTGSYPNPEGLTSAEYNPIPVYGNMSVRSGSFSVTASSDVSDRELIKLTTNGSASNAYLSVSGAAKGIFGNNHASSSIIAGTTTDNNFSFIRNNSEKLKFTASGVSFLDNVTGSNKNLKFDSGYFDTRISSSQFTSSYIKAIGIETDILKSNTYLTGVLGHFNELSASDLWTKRFYTEDIRTTRLTSSFSTIGDAISTKLSSSQVSSSEAKIIRIDSGILTASSVTASFGRYNVLTGSAIRADTLSTDLLTLTTITASVGVSGSVGRFNTLSASNFSLDNFVVNKLTASYITSSVNIRGGFIYGNNVNAGNMECEDLINTNRLLANNLNALIKSDDRLEGVNGKINFLKIATLGGGYSTSGTITLEPSYPGSTSDNFLQVGSLFQNQSGINSYFNHYIVPNKSRLFIANDSSSISSNYMVNFDGRPTENRVTFGKPVSFISGAAVTGTLTFFGIDGIKFGSYSSNILNEYESGEWTPILQGGTTQGSYQYVNRGPAIYERIGDIVYVHAILEILSIITPSSGELRITGLPYVASNNWQPINICYHEGITKTDIAYDYYYTSVRGEVAKDSVYFKLFSDRVKILKTNNSVSDVETNLTLTTSDISDINFLITFSGVYRTLPRSL